MLQQPFCTIFEISFYHNDFRPLHVSDKAPRNLHLQCGKLRIGRATGYKAMRRGCKQKEKNRDCVALKVTDISSISHTDVTKKGL